MADTTPSTDALIQMLGDPDPVVRTRATRELGKRGPEASAAIPALLEQLGDADPMARGMVAATLGKIGAVDAAEPLVAMLTDPVIPIRFWAADALGRIGVDTPEVRKALGTLAEDTHPMAKAAAAAARRALRTLGSA